MNRKKNSGLVNLKPVMSVITLKRLMNQTSQLKRDYIRLGKSASSK